MHKYLSKLTRNVSHLTGCFVIFSSSAIWDLLGVSDNTENKYSRDSSFPANILQTLWDIITSAPGRLLLLKGQDGHEQLRLPLPAAADRQKASSDSCIPVHFCPPVTMSSHSQLSVCKSWHRVWHLPLKCQPAELLLLLSAQRRHADWCSLRVWGQSARGPLCRANCLCRALYNGA